MYLVDTYLGAERRDEIKEGSESQLASPLI
jgi:hypothetical protein